MKTHIWLYEDAADAPTPPRKKNTCVPIVVSRRSRLLRRRSLRGSFPPELCYFALVFLVRPSSVALFLALPPCLCKVDNLVPKVICFSTSTAGAAYRPRQLGLALEGHS